MSNILLPWESMYWSSINAYSYIRKHISDGKIYTSIEDPLVNKGFRKGPDEWTFIVRDFNGHRIYVADDHIGFFFAASLEEAKQKADEMLINIGWRLINEDKHKVLI